MRISLNSVATSILAVAGLAFTAQAEEVNLPDTLGMSAYGSGAASYMQMISIGNFLKNEYGVSVRILPGENDISRMIPLKTGRVSLCGCGIGSYFAFEGVGVFAVPDWGPQDVRVITSSISDFGMVLAVAGDLGVETPADLKGLRVSYVRAADALNISTEAFLAFGGLTWDDVERVEFPGYGSAFKAVIAGRVDTVFTTTISPYSRQLAESPRGIVYPKLDPENSEGWAQLKAVAPYFQPHRATAAVGEDPNGEDYGPENPWIGATYPYPFILSYSDLEDEIAYSLIKVLIEDHDKYKDAAPGNSGYALENLTMKGVIPFHDAAVSYFKEIGHWTDEMQQHQNKLLKRQQILQETWRDYKALASPSDEEAFKKGWYEARAKALEAAGMDPVFSY